ncbi:hypothetical protein QR680_011954 [Steinernema hermaphroditum]|uniref:G-protein coupled receptors family 1 profile domain-containing protein n=1 Tax=Steinernema hermaphroditum TaxID=289476 RepID=A0AA39I0D8_9BILA|nr:hypothetical protein QR680_011954 [Steinernema hermaphroditum]
MSDPMAALSNGTAPAMLLVQPGYMTSAIVIISSILPSIIPNVFILVVCVKSGYIQDKFRDSIVAMTSGNLTSATVALLFHVFYVFVHLTETPIGFFTCSFLRRFTSLCYSPMMYGCVIVAVDRFFAVCRNYHFTRSHIFVLNMLLFFYPALLFALQITSNRVLDEDICGPTLASRYSWMGEANTWLLLAYPLIALCFNLYILFFVVRKAKKLKSLGARVSSTDTNQELKVVVGMIIQSILPIIAQIPMLASTIFYYKGVAVSRLVWNVNNVVWHVNLTLNPVFTVLFVKQFRVAVIKLFKCSSTVLVSNQQVSSVNHVSSSRTAFMTTRSTSS